MNNSNSVLNSEFLLHIANKCTNKLMLSHAFGSDFIENCLNLYKQYLLSSENNPELQNEIDEDLLNTMRSSAAYKLSEAGASPEEAVSGAQDCLPNIKTVILFLDRVKELNDEF